jgi:hypothetical protein
MILGGTAVRAAAVEVTWLHVPAGCPLSSGTILPGAQETPEVVACGGAGSFVFGNPGLRYVDAACGTVHSTSEVPTGIPEEPAPPLPPGFPCAGGSCLRHSADGPWVAMLDWPTEHGWSVAATIQEASDYRLGVQLYDLTRARLLGQPASPVSDLHVLLTLCVLAEAVREDSADRPVALNLSFGRHKGREACGAGPSLGCAITHVLSHLVVDKGIVAVAAAGNHREMLFPAASPDVLPAGALDLSHYQFAGEPRPSSQTPSAARALLLGYGLYLSTPGSNGETAYWAAPPGSSYAAALLTGWLGGYLASGGTLPVAPPGTTDAVWTPVPTAKGLALAYGPALLPGSELTGPRVLFERALGALPIAKEPPASFTLKLTGLAPARPALPVLYADDGNGPQPGVNPCLPCRIGGGGGLRQSPDTLVLDFSSSAGLPPQMDLQAIWLRVGAVFYRFDLSYDPAVRASFAAGRLLGLAFSGVSGILPAGEQPSLVLAVKVGNVTYWHEVPIHVLP